MEWKHDDYLKFARNDKYWGGAPTTDTLTARIIPEPSTAVAEFESGNVDILVIPQGETQAWEQTDEKQAMLQSAPALILYYVAINTTRGPLTDARVRQAINYAVDTRTILKQLMGGRGYLAPGVVSPILDGADTSRTRYAYNVAKAKELLAAAGHPNGIDVALWHSQDAVIARLSQAVQGYLNAADIRTKLVQRDASSAREAARKGETDMTLKTWYADYPDADSFLYRAVLRQQGPGWQRLVLRQPGVRQAVLASRTGRCEARSPLSLRRFARLRGRADGSAVLLQRPVRGAALDPQLQSSDNIQRSALDGREDRRAGSTPVART